VKKQYFTFITIIKNNPDNNRKEWTECEMDKQEMLIQKK
jgi:hypothetical protein